MNRRIPTWIIPVALLPYLGLMLWTGNARSEQFLIVGVVVALSLWSDKTRDVLHGLLPFLAFGVIYDLTRFTEPLVRHLRVHVSEPYRLEQALFGFQGADGRTTTPGHFFAAHHWPAVDLVAGLAYILYLYQALGFALYLALSSKDEPHRRLLSRFGWTFFAVNIAGFLTYYLYPAAPPWYVDAYGLGPARFDVLASPAAAIRWDQLTGLHYFAGFYGRSADVFGAIPSLHAAYPLLVLIYGWELRRKVFDGFNAAFLACVCFSAVYLQHHYVLDVLVGLGYAAAGFSIERVLSRRWYRKNGKKNERGQPTDVAALIGPAHLVGSQGQKPAALPPEGPQP